MNNTTKTLTGLLSTALASTSALATNGDNLIGIGPISRAMGGTGIAAPQDAIDWPALAKAPLSGGHIRAAALQAAFAAADAGTAIDQTLLLQAVRAEFAKLERPWSGGGST